MLRWLVFSALFAAMTLSAGADEQKSDPWQPVRFLIGEWEGTASGEPGAGTVKRSYQFTLNDKFIQETNTSTYPPQDATRREKSIITWGSSATTASARFSSFVNSMGKVL